MSETIMANNGVMLPIGDLPVAITYAGTLVQTMTVSYLGITYVQTYVNNGTVITHISQWEAQP